MLNILINSPKKLKTPIEKLFGTGRPKLEATETNRELLQKFQSRYWISAFNENNGIFKISRKKLHNKLNARKIK